MDIRIRTIAHRKQKYNTVGDYGGNKKKWIKISKLGNPIYEHAVALHEFIEQFLVKLAGIPVSDIDAFDKRFEREFKEGLHDADDEPGDDRRAPYYEQHQIATLIEKMFIKKCGASWQAYDDAITKVWRKENPHKNLK